MPIQQQCRMPATCTQISVQKTDVHKFLTQIHLILDSIEKSTCFVQHQTGHLYVFHFIKAAELSSVPTISPPRIDQQSKIHSYTGPFKVLKKQYQNILELPFHKMKLTKGICKDSN